MSANAFVHGIADDPAKRHPADFYPTPPSATQALLGVEQFAGTIWEPACGDVVERLESLGLDPRRLRDFLEGLS